MICADVEIDSTRKDLDSQLAKAQADLKSYRLKARKLMEDKDKEIDLLKARAKQRPQVRIAFLYFLVFSFRFPSVLCLSRAKTPD